MINFERKELYDVYDLAELFRLLRSEGGCPWDRAQTHASIRRNMIEEAYEAAEAIDSGSPDRLRDELGDVLMQVVLHAQMETETGTFSLNDVADGACRKLIDRHPHLFGGADAPVDWEELKRQQRGQTLQSDAMDDVSRALPALWQADKLQAKAARTGFDWPDALRACSKIEEETDELRRALQGDGNIREELGDLLFAVVSAGRLAGIDPEEALCAACAKFRRRFRAVEEAAAAGGKPMSDLTLEEWIARWKAAKEKS